MQLLAVAATASLAEVSPPKVEASYCRRGTYPAPIHSLAFSPASVQPPLLCAASGHGTVHLFRLDDNPERRVGFWVAQRKEQLHCASARVLGDLNTAM